MNSWLKIALSRVRTAIRSPLPSLCVVAPKISLSSATSIVPTLTNQRSSLIAKSLTSISILPVPITIVEVNEKEVKTQFLEGRSEQNFDDTFDEIYINELELGSYPMTSLPSNPISQWQGLRSGQEAVALPWVNNSSGNIQNEVVYANNAYTYHADCKGLSYQPYLIAIVRRICSAIGYSCDLSQWDSRQDLRFLLVCNTLPWAWDIYQFARALPHWSVTEFFEKLEQFLGGEFDIDHRNKSIKFTFTSNILLNAETIKIDKVVDSYTAEVSDTNESNYIEASNVRYKECKHNMWKFYSCP